MKIGIITFQRSRNYGASLQTFALCKFLLDNGYDCEVIDLYRPEITGYKASHLFPQLLGASERSVPYLGRVLDLTIRGLKRGLYVLLHKKQLMEMTRRFDAFHCKTRYSVPYKSIDDLYANAPFYDIYLTGSDQVWNPTFNFNIEPYFLTFLPESCKRVSYASSIGLSSIPESLKEKYTQWLMKYDALSVRENQAKELLRQLLPHKNVKVVCDPTLLISSEEWQDLAVEPHLKNYVICFTLNYHPELYRYASAIARQKGKELVIFSHRYRDDTVSYAYRIYDAGPREWLGWINSADTVITDSYHATVFSIHFRKPFLSYIAPDNKRGSRIIDLLETVGLSGHIIRDTSNNTNSSVDNYEDVWNKLSVFISDSKKYIKSILQ